jgi:two-component system chemotaxis response regulator CheB
LKISEKKITEDVKKEKDRLISKYGEAIETTDKIILIGSSTGGPDALSKILDKLPSKIPPIIIVQHMPSSYTKTWAGRLNAIYDFEVKEAEDNEEVIRNKVYIAQGGKHIELKYFGKKALIMINDNPPLHSCKPSVDVLFNSVKDEELAKRCISIILTGMGRDGAEGLLNLKNLGSYTIAQDKTLV